MKSIGNWLEQYTMKRLQEVLIVKVELNGEIEEILIFKGFSSSLTKATAFDPDVPILPADAQIKEINRLSSPYHPHQPHYIEQGLTWSDFQPLLLEVGLNVPVELF